MKLADIRIRDLEKVNFVIGDFNYSIRGDAAQESFTLA